MSQEARDYGELAERLKFHGRHASETQDECAVRKNVERDEAAQAIRTLQALLREKDEALEPFVAAFRHRREHPSLTDLGEVSERLPPR